MANPFIQGMPMHEDNMFLTDNKLNHQNHLTKNDDNKGYIHERKKLEVSFGRIE